MAKKRNCYRVQRATDGVWWLYWIDAYGRWIPEGSGSTKAQVFAQRDDLSAPHYHG